MKKQILKSISLVKRNALIPVVMFVMAIAAVPSAAHASEGGKSPKSEAVVKYIGDINDNLMFQVQYENTSNEPFLVSIKDENGYVFYSQYFTDKNFSKKFVFNKYENEGARLTFTISNSKESQSFQVNTKVVVNTVVEKL